MTDIADYGTAFVTHESGRWVVYTLVVFPDTSRTHRINDVTSCASGSAC